VCVALVVDAEEVEEVEKVEQAEEAMGKIRQTVW
jgi:hypothetical protein